MYGAKCGFHSGFTDYFTKMCKKSLGDRAEDV